MDVSGVIPLGHKYYVCVCVCVCVCVWKFALTLKEVGPMGAVILPMEPFHRGDSID